MHQVKTERQRNDVFCHRVEDLRITVVVKTAVQLALTR